MVIAAKNNALSKIFAKSGVSVFLYILALIMPITAFVLPTYKIRNMLVMKKWEWLATNIIVPAALLAVAAVLEYGLGIQVSYIKVMGGYFFVFLPIEILYYLFMKSKKMIPVFDRIIITAAVVSIFVFMYVQYASNDIAFIKARLEEFYLAEYDISSDSLNSVFQMMKDNALYIIYSYIGIVVYLTYYSIGRKEYKDWKISYQWLLFYIVPFLLIRFADTENIYLVNIMEMTKISFVVYGIKILYNLIRIKLKIDTAAQILAVIIGMDFPNIMFIIGGLHCFEFIKVKVIKINNGGR